jgi:hypothetical protein
MTKMRVSTGECGAEAGSVHEEERRECRVIGVVASTWALGPWKRAGWTPRGRVEQLQTIASQPASIACPVHFGNACPDAVGLWRVNRLGQKLHKSS